MSAFDKLRLRLAEPSTRTKSSNNIPDVGTENQSSSGNSFIRQAFAERKQNHGNFRANAPKPAVTVRAPKTRISEIAKNAYPDVSAGVR